jgi:3-oxoacyl-[acyl-carrier protein] reductase
MDLKLKNKKALVTAASYGLGYACAQTLSNEGAEVVICARDKSAVEEAALKITNISGNRVVGISADLTNEDQVKNLTDNTLEILGGVDILVLSTGHPPTFPFSSAKNDDWPFNLYWFNIWITT